ncbi:MAG: pyrroline-5-carboxylate reductase [Treponema sp.]|nr:pyrroline-5-carboxylate reductase [Treponema sp.]
MKELSDIRVGCIGCGTMGGAVISAMCKIINPASISISSKHYEKSELFAQKLGVNVSRSNRDVASNADYLFFAVKPYIMQEVLEEIKDCIKPSTVCISMAAGLSLKTLSSFLPYPFIRIMPNLPATVGEAMTALCASESVNADDVDVVMRLLSSSGKVEEVSEKLMDGVTAISGSGPAYGFMFIEALADAAVKFGMPRKQAYIYAAQTLKGAAEMSLKDGRSISELKDAVCSPSGTTIEAVISLEKSGFRSSVIEAATAAYNKSIELGKK